MTKSDFVAFSAVLSGIKEIKEIMAAAEKTKRLGRRTIVFVDEVHRFNKAQQDAFLPHVEHGNVTLIGATTENPSFEVISALLSRARVYVLKALKDDEIGHVIDRALTDRERGLATSNVIFDDEAKNALINLSNGDARSALNMLELCVAVAEASEPPPPHG